MGFKTVNKELATITIVLEGKVDATNYTDIENKILEEMKDEGVKTIVFDLNEVTYISSAGLRELFRSKKKMSGVQGEMIIRGANEDLMEVFEITGFVDLLDFEE